MPEQKIRERYNRNQALIKKVVLRADKAFIYDNSALRKPPSLVIGFSQSCVESTSEKIPKWECKLYELELSEFKGGLGKT